MAQAQAAIEVGTQQFGILAEQYGETLPLAIYRSAAGFYLGTWTDEGPFTRESQEYWRTERQAMNAMANGHWTQRWNL